MAVVLEMKVIPGSKKQGFEIDKAGNLKCRLKSKPEGGKANDELFRLLSKLLGVPMNCIKFLRGVTSRSKTIKIDVQQFEKDDVLAKLGVEIQSRIK